MYAVKNIFPTIQGEGCNAGRPALFIRMAGCNLWSGREKDRATAVCRFCDTDFLGGTAMTLDQIRAAVLEQLEGDLIVLTGGEPMLQLDAPLSRLLRQHAELAIETNGTRPVAGLADWVTVSPKQGAPFLQQSGDELKVVWPQRLDLDWLRTLRFRHFLLQPMDGFPGAVSTTVAEVRRRGGNWRLSLQGHKQAGIP
jgi:7-carboxy-7-deazaguanine synthase